MTIAEFKRKLRAAKESDKPVKVQLFKPNGDQWYMSTDFGPRKVSVIQSNSYALEVIVDGMTKNSWADWPKSGEVELLNDGKIQITRVDNGKPWSRLVYEF